MNAQSSTEPCVAFLYLGRRGALGRFTLELAEAAAQNSRIKAHFIVSSSNEIIGDLRAHSGSVLEVPTFESATPLALAKGFLAAKRSLIGHLERVRPTAVVALMPHVWTPLLSAAIKRRGIDYATIIHDGGPHPGDRTALTTRWLLRDAIGADLVITLSQAVANRLITERGIPAAKILPLFHPDLRFGGDGRARGADRARPVRILFFGRIMAYKGLDLLIDAISELKKSGHRLKLGVVGSGEISAENKDRLTALGAEVINRWIKDEEISGILERFDIMACSHVEASQSGVVAAAFGHAMPVAAMPIGGITEQVEDGRTGVLARSMDAASLAQALSRLIQDPALYDRISKDLCATAGARSMGRFFDEIVAAVCGRAN